VPDFNKVSGCGYFFYFNFWFLFFYTFRCMSCMIRVLLCSSTGTLGDLRLPCP
jgi:hypothetical protein